MPKKVVLLGLDSLNPDLIDCWKKDLPNFSSMMYGGTFGRMESTVPPGPPQTWTSVLTGKNPGQFGFWGPHYLDSLP